MSGEVVDCTFSALFVKKKSKAAVGMIVLCLYSPLTLAGYINK